MTEKEELGSMAGGKKIPQSRQAMEILRSAFVDWKQRGGVSV